MIYVIDFHQQRARVGIENFYYFSDKLLYRHSLINHSPQSYLSFRFKV